MQHLRYIIAICCLVGLNLANGQNAQQDFPEIPVHQKKLNWKQISTPNFEIYYYGNGQNLAKVASSHVEEEYLRICELLGYYSFEKMKLLLYLNKGDKAQSNIDRGYTVNASGGETYYVKNKAEVAFPGTIVDFKKELSLQIARSVVNEMLYGRGVKEIIRSSHFSKFAPWISEGLPQYLAQGWTVEMDGYMYETNIKAKAHFLNGLEGDEAKYIGQSVWNYVAEKYSPSSIGNIMLLLRATREISLGISGTLDVSYSGFLDGWRNFYGAQKAFLNKVYPDNYALSSDEKVLSEIKQNKESICAISPDGSKLGVANHSNGHLVVRVYEIATGKKIRKFKKRIYSTSNLVSQNETLLKWADTNRLYAVYRSSDEYSLMFNIKNKKKWRYASRSNMVMRDIMQHDIWNQKKQVLDDYDVVQNLNFTQDGEQVILSASSKGLNNLYLIIPRLNKTFKLTSDVFDNIDPAFVNENQIVFASNRINDSLGYKGSISEIEDNYDLYLFNLDDKKIVQLTNGLSHETSPKALNDSTLLYLDEGNGVRQVVKYNLNQFKPVGTLVAGSNISQLETQLGNNLFVRWQNETLISGVPSVFTSEAQKKTKRQEVLEARTKRIIVTPDTSRRWVSRLIDTSSVKASNATPQLRFGVKKAVSSFKIDPLFGSGLIGGITLTDIMEDHRIDAEIFALTDFSSSLVRLQYENKKHWADYRFNYTRKNIFYSTETEFSRFWLQEAKATFLMPFWSKYGIELTPTVLQSGLANVVNFTQDAQRITFGGLKARFIFNNTKEIKANQRLGTRALISFEHYAGLFSNDSTQLAKDRSFRRIDLDIRNYKRLFGTKIIWANRLSAGKSLGAAPKNYVFGGMDNWFFPRMELNELLSNGYATDLFFTSYITNMRGFGYNARNGDGFFMYNSELRVPLSSMFGKASSRSGFLDNLQLNLFADFGSAWTGPNPFNENNSFNRQVLGGNGNAFEITVLNYRNPVVMGYGAGLRTIVFGSFVKVDLGFGLEDYKGSEPMLMISLGNDF